MSIDFDQFRKDYKITSAEAKAIIKQLKYSVERDGTKQIIVGNNPFGVSDEYFLKHAIIEYRKTMRVDKTKMGDFFETYLKQDGKQSSHHISLAEIDTELVSPMYEGQVRTPNRKTDKILVDADAVVGITNQPAPEASTAITPAAAAAPQASIQALATALVEAQRAAAPPDPLAPQKALREAEEQGYLLTPEQLGQLIGMSKSTIGSKKSGFRKLGFQYEKVKEGSSTLWKVSRY